MKIVVAVDDFRLQKYNKNTKKGTPYGVPKCFFDMYDLLSDGRFIAAFTYFQDHGHHFVIDFGVALDITHEQLTGFHALLVCLVHDGGDLG